MLEKDVGRLEDLIGTETDLARLSGVVQESARTRGARVVGAYQVTCSDEAEWECAECFQRSFTSEGKDRLAVINDPAAVRQEHRALVAAITNAALQARRAVGDVEQRRPRTPTRFLVLPCVTINRPGPDSELLVGRYEIDWTGEVPATRYEGLGDDPAGYRIAHHHGRLSVQAAC